MPSTRKHDSSSEPIGIVIADGGAPPTETRFFAYVWGPVPDVDEQDLQETELLTAAA